MEPKIAVRFFVRQLLVDVGDGASAVFVGGKLSGKEDVPGGLSGELGSILLMATHI
jgi:hypothetical protein